MATYTELAGYVSDWANRDTSVLNYKTIQQCIRYAHDECYRTLRIAPLEVTRTGTVTQPDVDAGFLRIDDDLVEFIQLRKLSTKTVGAYSQFNKPYIVAEAHSDVRSFRGDSVTLYSDYAFYREGTEIYIYPQFQIDEEWQMYYYRRLPEANSRFLNNEVVNILGLERADADSPYAITQEQFDAYFTIFTDTGNDENDEPWRVDNMATNELIDPLLTPVDFIDLDFAITDERDDFDQNAQYVGILKEQWLRDVNEKALLFGALYQAFDYLDEPEQTGKYKSKFEQEIYKLNQEEMMRMNSGGNININFYNRLI